MAAAAGQASEQLSPAALAALTKALGNNGVADPKETLKNIRTTAMQLERSAPEISNMARQNMAILHAAETDLVAKINNWFDQTMDRTSQRFTASTRLVTFAGAFLVAFGLQVDTPALVNRFSADDALREAFVEEAQALYRDHKELQQAEQQGRALPAPTSSDEVGRKYRAFLATNGVITLPSTAGWRAGFANTSLFGMLITALLLSLGAPFWYGALGKLLQLRSALAVKDDAQRLERQLSEPSAKTSAESPGSGPPA